jgi:hypothetical protein
VRQWLADRLYGAAHRAGGRRILVLRHRDRHMWYNADLLAWLRRTAPAAAGLFELRRLGFVPKDPARYALLLPWLQDPLRERFPEAHAEAKRAEDAILAAGGAVVNPVDHLSHSIKSIASARLRAAGLPMPAVVPVPSGGTTRLPEELAFPVIAREDRRHGGPMVLCRDERELARVPWQELQQPVLVAFHDVRSEDGLYRKWRYVVAGEGGAPRHLVVSRDWVVKAEGRVEDEAVLTEELAYTAAESADPNHALLVRAARALGLDVVAFDYARTRSGELVVFEPNPFAVLWAPFNAADPRYRYQRPCVERLYATLCAYWLERAGFSAGASGELRALAAASAAAAPGVDGGGSRR